MKTWISNETHGKYLYIETGENISEFEREMARTAVSERFLPAAEVFRDRSICYEFCISGLISLNEWMDKLEMDAAHISEVLFQINAAVVYLRGYLLSERNLLIDGSGIFVDKKREKLIFCIVPSSDNDFEEGLKAVIHDMLIRIRTDDFDALRLGFRLLKQCEIKDFRLHDIIEIAGDRTAEGATDENLVGAADDKNPEPQTYMLHCTANHGSDITAEKKGCGRIYQESQEIRYAGEQERKQTEDAVWSAEMPDNKKQQDSFLDESDESEGQRNNHPAAGFILSQAILLGGVVTVYMLKGRTIVIKMLPLYLIVAACTAVYYAVDHVLQKRRRSSLRSVSSL